MKSRKIEQKTHEQQTKRISKTLHVKTLLKINRLKEKGFNLQYIIFNANQKFAWHL